MWDRASMGRGREQLSRRQTFSKAAEIGGKNGCGGGKGSNCSYEGSCEYVKGYGRLRYSLCDAIMTRQGEG